MFAGPPKIIESVVALLVPPAAREHVLGDLRERYAGTRSYLSDAVSAVPGAIAGRMLRITDWQVLAMEAGALYLSFLTAAWATLGAAYLCQHGDFLRLLLPVALALAALVVSDVYDSGARRTPVLAAGLGVGCAVALTEGKLALPAWILCSGGALGVVLISTVRMWFPPGGNRPRGEVL
ncbi:MAG TPA: hypothetical protein VME43_25195 [Bryobacteraceae bacterium]|nr:hypothetical protein [Bryobacteraceae bacterium]